MREIIFLNEKPYYWTCPYCGANLDPGEKCDCDEARKDRGEKKIIKESCSGFRRNKKSMIATKKPYISIDKPKTLADLHSIKKRVL